MMLQSPMRADFYGDLMNSPLWPIDRSQLVEVAALRGGSLRQAIVKPAEAVGVYLEDGLVERLLADAADEPGSLPMLQEALVLLWGTMSGRLLTRASYDALGHDGRSGLAVAMATKADATLAALPPDRQRVARRIFLRLVQFGEGRPDTRRQLGVDDLRAEFDDPVAFDDLLQHLIANRLLTPSTDEVRGLRVDMAHEALIVGWPTLRQWVDEQSGAEQTRRRLDGKAAEWVRLGRGRGGLLDEVELREADAWLDGRGTELGVGADFRAMVEASREAIAWARREAEETREERVRAAEALASLQKRRAEEQALAVAKLRRRVRVALALGGLALILAALASVATAVALQQRAEARKNEKAARAAAKDANSRRLAAHAKDELTTGNLDAALLLAARAVELDWTVDARASLFTALQAAGDLKYCLRQPGGWVCALAFHPGGTTLATGAKDGTIRLWDVTSGRTTAPLSGHEGSVWSVAFAPDGKALASGGKDGTVRLWDLDRGTSACLSRDTSDVWSVAFAPDGKRLAAGGKDGTVRLWDLGRKDGRVTSSKRGGTSPSTAVCFSSDGKRLASGRKDGTILLWDLGDPEASPVPLGRHSDSSICRFLSFSAGGKRLASGGGDGTIVLWDLHFRQKLETLSGHVGDVWSVAFAPDGKALASGGEDGTVRLWDLDRRPAPPNVATLKCHANPVYCVAFSQDGQMLASGGGDGTIKLRDVHPTEPTRPVRSVSFSRDGKRLASGGGDGTIVLWDLHFRQKLETLSGHVGDVWSVAFAPDGKALASGGKDGTVRLWDLDRRTNVPLAGHVGDVWSVAFAPDGKTLASGGEDGTVRLWNLATSRGVPINGQDGPVYSVAFHPHGKILAAGYWNNPVKLWDLTRTATPLRTLTEQAGKIYSVAFSPDGKLLASGSLDRTIKLWDVNSILGDNLSRFRF